LLGPALVNTSNGLNAIKFQTVATRSWNSTRTQPIQI
jgi:hypothetical protein